jgi:hypothetical protein
VSLGLFSVVMLVVLAAYINLISLDRQARASNQLSSSLSFAVEAMTRAVRTGTGYACNANTSVPNCAAGGNSISFTDSEGVYTRYGIVAHANGNNSIGYCTGSCTSLTPLTDQNINIQTMTFYVQGVGTDPSNRNIQPHATISISGTMLTEKGRTSSFSIQTGATQRLIEI